MLSRRHILRSVAVFLLLASLGWTQTAAVRGVESVGFTVQDMDRSVEFFTRVLEFEIVSDTEVADEAHERLSGVFGSRIRTVRLRLGEEIVELTEFLAPKGRPFPQDLKSNDHAFQHIAIIVSDMDKAYAHLRKHKVQHASTGPQKLPEWNKGAAGIQAFYFRDPDGHFLEILSFPPGKGLAKWHEKAKSGKLFLGIDHTAIVVSDTDQSLRFYRDLLGLTVAGESENYGTEQEHLNNVFGARLRITTLRGTSGPGIEFLEYLTPRDGRPAPKDMKANDLAFWVTALKVADVHLAAQSARKAKAGFISAQPVTTGGATAVILRDPDGHAIRLEQ